MMHYIIDGNNFIKRGGNRGDFEELKKELISLLERYTSSKKVRMTLVFDSRNPSALDIGRVKVIHAGDADRKISSELSRCTHPSSVIVVSDDRQVLRAAKTKGAGTQKVEEFKLFLDKKLGSRVKTGPGNNEKPSPSREDAEKWMKEYALRRTQRRG